MIFGESIMVVLETHESQMQHQMIDVLAITIAEASASEHREQSEHIVEDAKPASDTIIH